MKYILLIVISFSMVLSSCNNKEKLGTTPTEIPTMDELEVNSDFDWKTTQEIQLKLIASQSSIVEVTNKDGEVFQKAVIIANEAQTMKLTIPSYVDTVKLKFMDQEVTLELSSNILSYNFN